MPNSLEQRLAEIRRQVRNVLLTYGVSAATTVILGLVLIACLGDWLFHWNDAGVRLILGLSILAGAAFVIERYLVRPLRVPIDDLDIALRIEERHPGFKDSLASTVQFMQADIDPRVGSPALQRLVIDRTLAQFQYVDVDDIVETRAVRRVTLAAGAVCALVVLLVLSNREAATIALQRLAFPFSAPAWPRETSLHLLNADLQPLEFDPEDPLRIARGDVLELYVENTAGRLPSRVQLQYRFPDDKVVSETLRATSLRDDSGVGREVAPGQLHAVKGPLWFRAVGGDDDTMPWYQLLVIPPPVVESLQVTLTPPPYTRLPQQRQRDGAGHVQGFVGTRVDIAARLSKPVQSATLHVKDAHTYPTTLTDDNQQLTASFVIKDAGLYSYWLDLRDLEGFENSEAPRYEVRGIQDLVPEIFIEQPSSDLHVTPAAEIAIRTIAKDDLGLKAIRLQYRMGETDSSTPFTTIPLFPAPDSTAAPTKQPDNPESSSDGVPGQLKQHAAEMTWKMSDLKPAPGTRIVFHTEATDDYDLGPAEHIGHSISRTLTIVTPEQKSLEIAQRQAGLLEDLERAFKLQQQAHEQVSELQLQLNTVGQLRPQDLDMLQRVELSQRQVAAQLTSPADSLQSRARHLLQELHNNRLDDPQTTQRIEQIADELHRLDQDNFPAIEQELTRARKLSQPGASNNTKPATPPAPGHRPAEQAPPAADQATPAANTPDNTSPSTDAPADTTPPSPTKTAATKTTPGKTPPAKTPPRTAPRETPAREAPARTQHSSQQRALETVAENQSGVLESLQEMLQQLSQWRHESDAAQDLADMADGQTELNKQTADLGKETLTKPREELTPQQQADLSRLAERQKKQAERFDQFQNRLQEMIEQLSAANPTAAATLQDALDQAQQAATAGQMREASNQIGDNKLGAAGQTQQQVVDQLRELETILRNQRESDTESLVKKLKQAETELAQLGERQAELLRKVQQAKDIPDPAEREAQLQKLQKEQQQVQEELTRLSRKLQRLQVRRPTGASQRAGQRAEAAAEQLGAGDAEAAAREQQETLDDVEQARRELAHARREAEEQLAREQLERIADDLKAMISRQQSVITETQRLEELRASRGNWTRAQLRSLLDLASVQRALQQETEKLVDTLSAAEVFALALKGAARNMQRAVNLLGERQTGQPTQQAETAALQRFIDLIDALKPEPRDPNQQQPQPGAGEQGGGGEEGPQTDGIPALAQLKMLKTLQVELNDRTAELARQLEQNGQLTPAEIEELKLLGSEQGALADLTRNLLRESAENDAEPDEEPDESASDRTTGDSTTEPEDIPAEAPASGAAP